MIDAEKILGGMLGNAMGGMSGKAAVGMGLLGVAMAAAEHFMESSRQAPPVPPPGPAPGRAVPPPPPPPPGRENSPDSPVRPPVTDPVPSPPAPSGTPVAGNEALLLVRAMIASAGSDGFIDDEEKRRIMLKLQTVDLNPEEKRFLEEEMERPLDLSSITRQVSDPELAKKVYIVSLLAVDVDTHEERRYLERLAMELKLDERVLNDIHSSLGIPRPRKP